MIFILSSAEGTSVFKPTTCIIVLFLWGGHCCPMHCDLFKIYCGYPNLGIRTWICRLNFAERPIFSGFRFFNEPEISDLGPQVKVPAGGLLLRIFTSWKNPSTSIGFEPANLGSRDEHVTPRPPRPTYARHWNCRVNRRYKEAYVLVCLPRGNKQTPRNIYKKIRRWRDIRKKSEDIYIFRLFLSLLTWIILPYLRGLYSFELGLLFFLRCTRLGVYTVIIAGWSSNSNYSLLVYIYRVSMYVRDELRNYWTDFDQIL